MKSVDLLTAMPRCTAKDLATEIVKLAPREQPNLAIGGALAAMSALSAKVKTPNDMGTDLIVFLVAETSQGKDAPLKYARSAIRHALGAVDDGRIKSGMEMIRAALKNEGKLVYLMDECASLFSAIGSARSEHYMKEIGNQLLKMTTGNVVEMSSDDRETIINELTKKTADLKKLADKFKSDESVSIDYQLEYDETKSRLDWVKSGAEGVHVTLLGATQPANLPKIINEKNMNDGLLGRSLFCFAPTKTPKLKRTLTNGSNKLSPSLLARITALYGDLRLIDINTPITYDEAAWREMERITDDYESKIDEEHELRGINGRAFETIEKIATLVSLDDRVINIDAVRWAELVFQSQISKIKSELKVDQYSAIDGKIDPLEYNEALTAKIFSECGKHDGPVQISTIKARIDRTKQFRLINKLPKFVKYVREFDYINLLPNNAPTKKQRETITPIEFILLMMVEKGFLKRDLAIRGNGFGKVSKTELFDDYYVYHEDTN